MKPIVTILDTGALTAGLNLFARGFKAVLNGEEIGLQMMKGAWRTFRALSKGVEIGESASKVARILRTAGTVLTNLGVVLDGILLIYEAIEGAKQREELRKGIKELSGRRLIAHQLKQKMFATVDALNGNVGVVVTYNVLKQNNTDPAQMEQVMSQLVGSFVDRMKDNLAEITAEKTFKTLENRDSTPIQQWTNEDPSLSEMLKWIDEQQPLDVKSSKSLQLKWRLEWRSKR